MVRAVLLASLVGAGSVWANPLIIGLSVGDLTGQDLKSDGTTAWLIATEGNNEVLFRTDGTSAGTVRVKSFSPVGGFRSAIGIRAVAPGVAFVQVGSGTLELTDGSASPFISLGAPGVRLSFAGRASSGRAFFYMTQSNFTTPLPLYTSDGTPAGTFVVSGVSITSGARSGAAIVGAQLYFVASNGDVGVTDGVTTSVFLAKTSTRVATSVYACGSTLYVVASESSSTVVSASVPPAVPATLAATGSFSVNELTCAGGLAYLATRSSSFGDELWRSDGTASGTYLVRELNPGPASSLVGSAFAAHADGGVHLVATDGTGFQVWYAEAADAGLTVASNVGSTPNLLPVTSGPWAFFQSNGSSAMANGTQFVSLDVAISTTRLSSWKSSPVPVTVGSKLLSFGSTNSSSFIRDQLWVFDTAAPFAFDDGGVVDSGMVFDAGVADAGRADAGINDAGINDAGTTDAGTTDAGTTDAGTTDAGITDAGVTDAGFVDASVPFDAGTMPPNDAGLEVPDAGTSGTMASGCGCQSDASLLPLVLAGLALVRRRARR